MMVQFHPQSHVKSVQLVNIQAHHHGLVIVVNNLHLTIQKINNVNAMQAITKQAHKILVF